MTLAALLFLGGVALGCVVEEAREWAFWRREAVKAFTARAPMSTEMPTVTELHESTWTEQP